MWVPAKLQVYNPHEYYYYVCIINHAEIGVVFTNLAWAHFVAIFPVNIPGVLRLHYTSFIKISCRIGPPEDCNVSPGGSNVHNYAQLPKPIHMAGCEYRTVRHPST